MQRVKQIAHVPVVPQRVPQRGVTSWRGDRDGGVARRMAHTPKRLCLCVCVYTFPHSAESTAAIFVRQSYAGRRQITTCRRRRHRRTERPGLVVVVIAWLVYRSFRSF